MTDAPPAVHELDLAIAARLRPRDGGPQATFDVAIDPGFTVGDKPNGGYLLALVAKAAGDALAEAGTDHPHPLAATAHFLRAPQLAPATVEVEVLRAGRSASQVRATLEQDGHRCVDVTLTMGRLPDLDDAPAADWTALPPVDVAPYDDCIRIPARPPGGDFVVAIQERLDTRLDPAVLGWALGQPSGRGELRGWMSLADGRAADPLALLFFLDGLPPATFDVVRTGWVPTLSLTAYVRALPAPGPVRIRMRAQQVGDGRVDEVCEVWDARGRLVGQATQLAALRWEPETPIAPFPG